MKPHSILLLALAATSINATTPDLQGNPLGGRLAERACPHVREIDGVKRCIGNKGGREAEAIQIEDRMTEGGFNSGEEKPERRSPRVDGSSWKRHETEDVEKRICPPSRKRDGAGQEDCMISRDRRDGVHIERVSKAETGKRDADSSAVCVSCRFKRWFDPNSGRDKKVRDAFVTDPERLEGSEAGDTLITRDIDQREADPDWIAALNGPNREKRAGGGDGGGSSGGDSGSSSEGSSSSGNDEGSLGSGSSGAAAGSSGGSEGKAAAIGLSMGLCVAVTALWIGKEVLGWGFTMLLGVLVGMEDALLVFDS